MPYYIGVNSKKIFIACILPTFLLASVLGLEGEFVFDSRDSIEKNPGQGMLIQTEPAGARLFIDGQFVGQSPLSVETLVSGPRFILIQKEGYRSRSGIVDVSDSYHLKLRLELQRKEGSLLISLPVNEAPPTITLNGQPISGGLHRLPAGYYQLLIRGWGIEQIQQSFFLEDAATIELPILLLPRPGRLLGLKGPGKSYNPQLPGQEKGLPLSIKTDGPCTVRLLAKDQQGLALAEELLISASGEWTEVFLPLDGEKLLGHKGLIVQASNLEAEDQVFLQEIAITTSSRRPPLAGMALLPGSLINAKAVRPPASSGSLAMSLSPISLTPQGAEQNIAFLSKLEYAPAELWSLGIKTGVLLEPQQRPVFLGLSLAGSPLVFKDFSWGLGISAGHLFFFGQDIGQFDGESGLALALPLSYSPISLPIEINCSPLLLAPLIFNGNTFLEMQLGLSLSFFLQSLSLNSSYAAVWAKEKALEHRAALELSYRMPRGHQEIGLSAQYRGDGKNYRIKYAVIYAFLF